jgi:hypothetical protein
MELIDLYTKQEQIFNDILIERFHNITVPRLRENIETYKQNTRNYAAALRQNGQLTHRGRQVITKPDLKRICQEEGWKALLNDMEVSNNVRL